MKINKVSIIGLGALGILLATKIKDNFDGELNIIADKKRIEKYAAEGVYCNGKRCDFDYVLPKTKDISDLIIVAVKYNGLKKAIKYIKNHVGPNTVIISLLNGIVSEEMIAEEYGFDKVLYCTAQGMDAVRVNNELRYHDSGLIVFGEKEKGVISDKVKRLEEFFIKSKIPYLVDTDMRKRIWGKFMLNVGVNQTLAIYNKGNYSSLQREGEERDLMIAAMKEVLPLAQRMNVDLTEKDMQYWMGVIDNLNPEGKPSMQQDIEAGRKTELELFAGTVIKLGKKLKIDTPVNRQIYRKIKQLEKGNR